MLPNLNQPNRMKKILFILALLAMVVLPKVAPAQKPSERRQLSDGVALVALEDRPGRGGDGTVTDCGIASGTGGNFGIGGSTLPKNALSERTFQLLKVPIQRTKSAASHDRKSRVGARRLVFAFGCPSDFSEASMQNRVDGIRSCHLFRVKLSPLPICNLFRIYRKLA